MEHSGSRSQYWDQFHGFQHDPTAALAHEFFRLTVHMGWSAKNKKQRHRQFECYAAEFAALYGTNASKLEAWQDLCQDAGIVPPPSSITKCKKALNQVYVNLVNLMDHHRNPDIPVKKFSSFKAFQEYTKGGNIFPKIKAKENSFLKGLLRRVF